MLSVQLQVGDHLAAGHLHLDGLLAQLLVPHRQLVRPIRDTVDLVGAIEAGDRYISLPRVDEVSAAVDGAIGEVLKGKTVKDLLLDDEEAEPAG